MKAKRIIARVLALLAMIAFLAMCGFAETESVIGAILSLGVFAICVLLGNRLPEDVWDK